MVNIVHQDLGSFEQWASVDWSILLAPTSLAARVSCKKSVRLKPRWSNKWSKCIRRIYLNLLRASLIMVDRNQRQRLSILIFWSGIGSGLLSAFDCQNRIAREIWIARKLKLWSSYFKVWWWYSWVLKRFFVRSSSMAHRNPIQLSAIGKFLNFAES